MLKSRLVNRLILGAVLVAALAAGGCDRQSRKKAQPQAAASATAPARAGEAAGAIDRSHKGGALPEFTLVDPTGKSIAMPSFKGKRVLVNLWATWCAPCIAELPTLNAVASRLNAEVTVVTVSQDMGDPAKVQAFLDQHQFSRLPAWLDPKGDLAAQYHVQDLPTSILYDSSGREVWRVAGGRDWTSAESSALLAEGAD